MIAFDPYPILKQMSSCFASVLSVQLHTPTSQTNGCQKFDIIALIRPLFCVVNEFVNRNDEDHLQNILFVSLSGTKIDLREDREFVSQLQRQNIQPIKREQGQRLCKKIRAFKYVECSALTQKGLKQVRREVRLLGKVYR
jgi:hypothetical protein